MATPDSDEPTATGRESAAVEATEAVELPAPLVERVEELLGYTPYDGVDEYVAVVLRETLARVEAASDDDPVQMDETEVRDRLESLGYLDS